ncbi:MAG: decarboxylating 6-phosphogluconate dehydrogenase [Acidimicrobiia bacterium]|nr:decarboxylating 6-phosphogluconate dehydrogenase [Acidimicrobiia bacterium]
MKIGMVGLGRMGANMTLRIVQHGHEVVAWDRNEESVKGVSSEGAQGVGSLEDLVRALDPPRAVWIMLPSGEPTEATIEALANMLEGGDTIVDGGNSNFRLAIADAERLRHDHGINFVDAGVSGGVWGLKEGYCLMVGGDADVVKRLEPVFLALAPADGYAHVGPIGAGHFVKMVHNGIEYGLLQAYAEGFALMHKADEFNLDLHQIAELWRRGSVVRSWLLDLAALALANEAEFGKVRGFVEDSGEGRWTVDEAVARGVATPVMAISLFERFQSREPDSFAAKIIAALRNQFGGHKFFEESAGAEANKPEGSDDVARTAGEPAASS